MRRVFLLWENSDIGGSDLSNSRAFLFSFFLHVSWLVFFCMCLQFLALATPVWLFRMHKNHQFLGSFEDTVDRFSVRTRNTAWTLQWDRDCFSVSDCLSVASAWFGQKLSQWRCRRESIFNLPPITHTGINVPHTHVGWQFCFFYKTALPFLCLMYICAAFLFPSHVATGFFSVCSIRCYIFFSVVFFF
jgi:hypothetical protein